MIEKHLFGMSRKPMPRECPDCHGSMSTVVFDQPIPYRSHSQWYRECQCGCYVIWTYPNTFRRRHVLPLFDMPDMRIEIGVA